MTTQIRTIQIIKNRIKGSHLKKKTGNSKQQICY